MVAMETAEFLFSTELHVDTAKDMTDTSRLSFDLAHATSLDALSPFVHIPRALSVGLDDLRSMPIGHYLLWNRGSEFLHDLSAGLSGVKVDCQAGVGVIGSSLGGGGAIALKYHTALEDSIRDNFPGNHCINCMCHSTENLYRYARVASPAKLFKSCPGTHPSSALSCEHAAICHTLYTVQVHCA